MIKRQFRSLAAAQILAALAVTVSLLIDGMLTSRFLGKDAITAFGLAYSLIILFVAVGGTIASGGQCLCRNALGSGSKEGVEASFSTAVTMGAAVSVLSVVIVFAFSDPVSLAMGAVQGTEVQLLTKDYLKGYILGCPGFILMQTINPFLHLIGKKRVVMAGVVAMIVTDVCADLLNVFVFHLGTLGMGLATALSYYAAMAVSLRCVFRNPDTFRFRFRLATPLCIRNILVLGSTYALYQGCRAQSSPN